MNIGHSAFCLVAALISSSVFAWDGTDEEGRSVYIGKGNLVRSGRTITVEIDGEERDVTVDSIRSSGSGASIEFTDEDTGESGSADMD